MNPMNLPKEISKIAVTHGLSKDVIDLLEKKASLIQEELEQAILREKEKDIKIRELQSKLNDLQPSGFFAHDGLLWKKKGDSFEDRPYCPECSNHPVMHEFPPKHIDTPMVWSCPNKHNFAYIEKP